MEIFNYCLQLIDMCVKHDKTHSALTNKIMIVMMTHESVAGDAKTLGNIFVEIHKELKLDKDRTVALLGATRETLLDLKSKGQAIFRNYCSASIENFMELYKEAFPFLRKNDLDIKDIDETNAGNLKHFIDGDNDSESERSCEDNSGSDRSVEFELDEGDIKNTLESMSDNDNNNDNDKRKRAKSKQYRENISKRRKTGSDEEQSGQDDDVESDEDEDDEDDESDESDEDDESVQDEDEEDEDDEDDDDDEDDE
jgi:hypothetical protein